MNNLRPLPPGHEKVTYRNHLELRYLRWDYLVKTANPKEALLKSKVRAIRYAARLAYGKNTYEFKFMGMELEDIESIATVYAVSYLGLYSIEKDKERLKAFQAKFERENGRKPSKEDIAKKDDYSLMHFIRQRLLECATIMRQYCKGEAGFSYYSVFKRIVGDQSPSDDDLIENPMRYGWKRVQWAEFKQVKDRFPIVAPGYRLTLDGVDYRIATHTTSMHHSDLTIGDLVDKTTLHTETAEDLMIDMQETNSRKVSVRGVAFNISRSERLSILVDLYKERPLKVQYRILTRLTGWLKRRNGFQNEMEEEIAKVKKMMVSLSSKISKGSND